MCGPYAADQSCSPDPTATSYEEKGLVTTECVQGCAESTVSIFEQNTDYIFMM